MQSNDSVFDSFYIHLLKMIVSEFTLIDNQSNITTSLIRIVCHADDSILLGSWIQETDHRFIENQVRFFFCYNAQFKTFGEGFVMLLINSFGQ